MDIVPERVELLNRKKSPIVDREIQSYLANRDLNLVATTDSAGYAGADCVIIATPTNYIPENNSFDTTSIEAVLDVLAQVNPGATIVIKSTVPVGYLESLRKRYPGLPNLLFSPEFLREGKALYDNLHPSRIIVGTPKDCDPELVKRTESFAACPVVHNFEDFKSQCDVIVANRMEDSLKDCQDKIYTRDLFGRD